MFKSLLIFSLFFIVSCALPGPRDRSEELANQAVVNNSELTPVDPQIPQVDNDLKDDESDFEKIPNEFNRQVQKWVDYFTGRGRKHMEVYLARSSRYLPKMKEILKQQGVPEDLVYIALIESGFSPTAHSHANAVGYWQFIRGTGKRYGLRINSLVDERRDFVYATIAASQYFKALYNLFGSWYLAIASYNVGENRIKRLVMKYYTRDFWELAKRRKLPRETINYVPKYLAARMIVKHPEKYGFTNIKYQEPLSYVEVNFDHPINLRKFAASMGLPHKKITRLNPSYKRSIAPLYGQNLTLRVPTHLKEQALSAARVSRVSSSVVSRASSGDWFWYRIRRGDNLSTLARRFGTTASQIRSFNRMGRRSRLIAGRRLKMPERNVRVRGRTAKVSQAVVEASRNDSKDGGYTTYRIRRGDTLSTIAERYGTSIASLRSLNNLGRRSTLYAGQNLLIPSDTNFVSNQQFTYYRVRRGDTLIEIAKKFNTSVSELRKLNSMGRRSMLYSGQKIKVPASQSRARSSSASQISKYKIRRGDTLYGIAKRFGVKVSEIARHNDISRRAQIRIGQVLSIPK